MPSGGSYAGGRLKPIAAFALNSGNSLAGRMLDVVTNVCASNWLSAEPGPLSVNAVVPNTPPVPLNGSVATSSSSAAMTLVQAPR